MCSRSGGAGGPQPDWRSAGALKTANRRALYDLKEKRLTRRCGGSASTVIAPNVLPGAVNSPPTDQGVQDLRRKRPRAGGADAALVSSAVSGNEYGDHALRDVRRGRSIRDGTPLSAHNLAGQERVAQPRIKENCRGRFRRRRQSPHPCSPASGGRCRDRGRTGRARGRPYGPPSPQGSWAWRRRPAQADR